MAMHLDTTDELKNKRKDYRILHRRILTFLRYEYSDYQIMRRYFTKEKAPNSSEIANSLNVSSKTIRRHLNDISMSDLMVLTGQYASLLKNRKPDDFSGIMTDLLGKL